MAQNLYTATIDLRQGVRMHRIGRLFAQNDKLAHRFDITILDDGVAADLTGLSTSAYFIRPDDGVVTIQGTISGNVVSVALPSACYEVPGHFSMIIKIHAGQVTSASNITAVFWGDGTITRTETNIIIDPAHVVPNLDELLAQIATIDAATRAANTAAENANTKAGLAEEKATAANDIANKLENIDATATTLATGESATATVTTVSGHYRINLGLPRGAKGETGPQGPAGSVATLGGTVTLTASGWSSSAPYTQTVSSQNVTTTAQVIVAPDPAYRAAWASCGIACTAQGAQSLTFTADAKPSADVTVNILVF